MNEAPSQQTGLGDSFASQGTPQTNPFTADLKGEFNSNFGTNTNAVSQIFKEGGFVNQNRIKYIGLGVLALLLVGVLIYAFSGDEATESEEGEKEKTAETEAADEPADDAEESGSDKKQAEAEKPQAPAATAAAAAAVPAAPAAPVARAKTSQSARPIGSGKISLAEPANNSSLSYDESQGPAQFSWTGGSGYIVFSRHQSMQPAEMRVRVNGNSYAFHHPWPGTWYWRVENASGKSETRTFVVNPPERRNISVSQPTSGGSVVGNGGTVSWQGDSRVAYYRVEFSADNWTNPKYRFASSGNSVQVRGVPAGQYKMRIGAFSEVAGRWEYTTPIPVTVQ